MRKKEEFIDDGRTIVDMSGVERPALFGRNFKAEKERSEEPTEEENIRPWEKDKDKISRSDRWEIFKGAFKASLLIWLSYAVVFGIVILIMYLVFKRRLGA